jgi:hypothetical protein
LNEKESPDFLFPSTAFFPEKNQKFQRGISKETTQQRLVRGIDALWRTEV